MRLVESDERHIDRAGAVRSVAAREPEPSDLAATHLHLHPVRVRAKVMAEQERERPESEPASMVPRSR